MVVGLALSRNSWKPFSAGVDLGGEPSSALLWDAWENDRDSLGMNVDIARGGLRMSSEPHRVPVEAYKHAAEFKDVLAGMRAGSNVIAKSSAD